MNKNYIFPFLLLLAVGFWQCTPKNASMGNNTNDPESFRANKPAAGPAPKIEMGKYESFTLDNGLKVIVVQNAKLPRVSFQLLVDAPPVSQGQSAGLIDFAGEMLTRGTKKRSKADIDESVDFIGANLSSSGSGLFASSLSKHKETLLSIMSEVLLEPAFLPEEFEKAKKQTLSGLTASKDDPDYIASSVGQVLRNGANHPYGEIVTENSVNNVTLEQAISYYNSFWRPNVSYLAVVGDITVEEAKKLVPKYFNSWQKKEILKKNPDAPAFPTETTVDFVDKPGAVQSVVNITYPVNMPHTAEDRVAASLMNAIFGGVFSSRINLNLREKNAFTYGARSSLNADRIVGSFSAGASVGNQVTDKAIQELLFEINKMRTEKVSADELSLAKNVLSGEFARSMERPQTVANFALNIARYGLPQNYYDTYLEKIESATADDVLRAAQKYLKPDQARIVVVGNKKEVAPKLNGFATKKQVDFYDVNGNKLDDEAFKIPAGLTAEKVLTDYINALGGKDAIAKIKTLEMKGNASLSGFDLSMNSVYLQPDKMAMSISAQGQVMQSVIVNGMRAKVSNMGQSQMLEGEAANDYIEQAKIIEELHFEKENKKVTLSGAEVVEGKNCYQLEVSEADGSSTVYYYDANTKLKVRSISTRQVGDQTIQQTADYSDYKAVEGVLFPYTNKISGGGMPAPLVVKYSEIKVNTAVDAAVFDF
jgi:zinc protease